jgi:hypothetical protein
MVAPFVLAVPGIFVGVVMAYIGFRHAQSNFFASLTVCALAGVLIGLSMRLLTS